VLERWTRLRRKRQGLSGQHSDLRLDLLLQRINE
jgi:hypothetical protein